MMYTNIFTSNVMYNIIYTYNNNNNIVICSISKTSHFEAIENNYYRIDTN